MKSLRLTITLLVALCGFGLAALAHAADLGAAVQQVQDMNYRNCPQVAIPACKAGERVVTLTGGNGCPVSKCTADLTPSTCNTNIPVCKKGEHLVSAQASSGCTLSQCVPDIQIGGTCPPEPIVDCAPGYTAVKDFDVNGCAKTLCRKKNDSCPTTMNIPVCKAGQHLTEMQTENGCTISKCVDDLRRECNSDKEANIRACKKGEHLETTMNSAGCSTSKCVPDVTSPNCPTVNIPVCKAGQHLQDAYDGKCNYPRCVPDTTNCPVQNRPICREGEDLVSYNTPQGCPMVKCQTKRPVDCPTTMNIPVCKAGQHLQDAYDGKCNYPRCVPDTTNCPVQNRPICREGEDLVSYNTPQGCPMVKCQTKRPVDCPTTMNIPACKKGEHLVRQDGRDGCKPAICVPDVTPPSCPTVNIPVCKAGQHLQDAYDGKCNYPRCVPDTTNCPVQNRPICREGEDLVGYNTPQGCPMVKCQTKRPVDCPTANIKACKPGEHIVSQPGSNGCTVNKCVPDFVSPTCNTNIPVCKKGEHLVSSQASSGCVLSHCEPDATTPNCPTMNIPVCPAGQTPTTTTDANGCKSAVCKVGACPNVANFNKPLCPDDHVVPVIKNGCVTGYTCGEPRRFRFH